MVHHSTRPCKDQPGHINQLETPLMLTMQTETALLNLSLKLNILPGRIPPFQEALYGAESSV